MLVRARVVKQLKAAAALPPPPETMGQVFRRFDVDGGGTLDYKELRAAIESLRPPLDLTKPDAVTALAEVESSGAALSQQEFKTLVKRIKGVKLKTSLQTAMAGMSMAAAGAAGRACSRSARPRSRA